MFPLRARTTPSAPMVAAVMGLELVMPPDWAAPQRLVAQVGLGVATYALVSLMQHRRLQAMYQEFRALGRATELIEGPKPSSSSRGFRALPDDPSSFA